ncbi:hypothetical protein PG997_001887 [Apiospora hydei]|uniref:Methyltransferase domain-containing protein n=1 Tax=Apiospora hydei TaxID=1337664 RepID=A0ABR1X7T4_9PEZI
MDQSTGMDYDPATYWTTSAKNFRSSARLHLQHFLCQRTFGYLLESHVQDFVSHSQDERSGPLRVADLGCGNGAWLCDLHDELAKSGITAQLDGYDVNAASFPAPAFLPPSIRLKELDILKPLPEDLVGVFDIVHIRAFASLLVDTGVAPLLPFIHAMLRPGGYVQWEEIRGDKFIVEASGDTPGVACNTISQILQAGGKARGSDFTFIDQLDQGIKSHGGFDDVQKRVFEKRRQDYKAWTEDILMVWGEIAVHFPLKADASSAKITKESFLDLYRRAVEETEQGVAVHQGVIVTAVGRKAA